MKTTHALYFAFAVLIVAAFLVGDEEGKGPLSEVSSGRASTAPQAVETDRTSAKKAPLFGSSSVDDDISEYYDTEESAPNSDTLPETQNSSPVSRTDAGEIAERPPALSVAGESVSQPETQNIER